MNQLLTLEKLKKMKPQTIFAQGVGLIEHPWFNNATKVSEGGSLEEDGKHTLVKWVAIRGYAYDWAIYHSMDANLCPHDFFNDHCHIHCSDGDVASCGAKLFDKKKILEFVPCDKEALDAYRY